MWDLIVSVPDHCLSFYLLCRSKHHFHAGFDANLEIIFWCKQYTGQQFEAQHLICI